MLFFWFSRQLLLDHICTFSKHSNVLLRRNRRYFLRSKHPTFLLNCRQLTQSREEINPLFRSLEKQPNVTTNFLDTEQSILSQIDCAKNGKEIDEIFTNIHTVHSNNTNIIIHLSRYYCQAIDRLLELREVSKALEYFNKMTQQNLYPTLRCWARLVNALTRSFKTFRIGLKVFEAMRRSPIVPDAVCYQIVIYNCHIFREQKYALKYYREMTKKGILPSVETYKALIEMFIKLKKFTKAQQIVEALISQFGNQENLPSEVWNTILQMYCLARDIFNAEKTYSQMVANNKSLESRSYHAMLDMYIETGHPEKAIQLYSSLGSFHKDSNNIAVLNGLLLKAYTLANRIIDAWKLFEELKNSHSLTTVHCNSMLSILAKQGKVDECMKIIDQMKLNSIPFSSFTYTSLITLCAFTGQPQKGLDYFMEALNTRMINESAIFQALQLCTTYKMGPVASRIISHPKVLLYRVNLVHIIKAIEANFVSGQVVMALELVFLLKKIRLYLNENFVHQLCSFLDSVSLPSQLTLEKERWKEWKFQHKDWNGHNKEREEFLSFIDRCIQALRSSAADTKKQ